MLSFFPRGVLDEILNLIESVSEGFPSYSCRNHKLIYASKLLFNMYVMCTYFHSTEGVKSNVYYNYVFACFARAHFRISDFARRLLRTLSTLISIVNSCIIFSFLQHCHKVMSENKTNTETDFMH